MMSAKIVMENSSEFAKKGLDARVIVEALISAGVASCIAGSSRPCSGAEHLFSHALDKIAPGIGLHGEKCGIGSIMIAKLQGTRLEKNCKDIERCRCSNNCKTNWSKSRCNNLAKALTMAQELRPERYTILKEVKMTKKRALKSCKKY